jgi:hypothetical protein
VTHKQIANLSHDAGVPSQKNSFLPIEEFEKIQQTQAHIERLQYTHLSLAKHLWKEKPGFCIFPRSIFFGDLLVSCSVSSSVCCSPPVVVLASGQLVESILVKGHALSFGPSNPNTM